MYYYSMSNIGQAQEFRKYIETEVLKIIKALAEKGETTKERIQEIAKITLELIKPTMTLEELYQNAVKLDDNFSELAPVVMQIMKEYEEKHEKKVLEQVTQLVRNREYDQAEEAVKKVLQFKIQN